MRVRTGDLQTVDRSGEFFTVKKVGRTRELTPEGFLLCRDVRIARTGEMLYLEEELPGLKAGSDKILRVTRSADDLFRPESIASYNGKAVTLDHPDEDVNPENWRELAVGITLNARRGEGADSEHLLADLLITEARGIAALGGVDGEDNEDWEVSCGYDADYEQITPGRARQHNLIGNHVALVEKGRCGPTCSIGDADMRTRDERRPRRSWQDRIRRAFRARDEEALTEAMEMAEDEMTNGVEGESGPDAGGEHKVVIEVRGPESAVQRQEQQGQDEVAEEVQERTGDEEAPAWFTAHVEQNNARFTKIEEALSKLSGAGTSDEEAEEVEERTDDEESEEGEGERTDDEEAEEGEAEKGGTKDRARTGDSATLSAAFQDMIARAEIIAPGIKLPTFDAKVSAKQTRDRMCAFKRRALVRAMEDDGNASLLEPVVGKGRDLSKLTCDNVGVMFTAASELVKRANSAITNTSYVHDGDRRGGLPATIADINQKNREFWKGKGGAL